MGEGDTGAVYFATAAGDNGNGYRLLSARGIRTLQVFLREHGADCVRQFMQVCMANSDSKLNQDQNRI